MLDWSFRGLSKLGLTPGVCGYVQVKRWLIQRRLMKQMPTQHGLILRHAVKLSKSNSPPTFRNSLPHYYRSLVYYRSLGIVPFFLAFFCLHGQLKAVVEEQPNGSDFNESAEISVVSYHRDIAPILRLKCLGCHQPAKPLGGIQLSSVAGMMETGESGSAAVIPGSPDASELLRQITPDPNDRWAAMPKDSEPLLAAEIEMIRRWILQGAHDDSPQSAPTYDSNNPPQYQRPPLVSALAFSPDGKWLAVNGYHETILIDTRHFQAAARMVGLSNRIEWLKFSPDSSRLAVTGGSPGRFGEVQIWSIPDAQLLMSHQSTFDTLFGGDFSPDGKLFAFGATDRVVRAIDSETGEQRLHQGAHEDWSLATVFTADGSHLISGGRDRTVKLTEVATERFVDNVTSITPGALKGGISSLAMHPLENHVLVGGADGVPKIYRIFRETQRRIGDDANLIRQFPQMRGRIFGVTISGSGDLFAVVSTLDGISQLRVYPFDFTGEMPEEVKAANAKAISERSEQEHQLINQFISQTSPAILELEVDDSLYAVAFHPSGNSIATGGADGWVRVYSVPSGELKSQFVAVPIAGTDQTEAASISSLDEASPRVSPKDDRWSVSSLAETGLPGKRHLGIGLPSTGSGLQLPLSAHPDLEQERQLLPQARFVRLQVQPERVDLEGFWDTVQIVVTAEYADGQLFDVTRLVNFAASEKAVHVDSTGLTRAYSLGSDLLKISFQGETVNVPVMVMPSKQQQTDFVRDVNPVLSRLGCNSGTCHGGQQGKNGFQLSLRGYDPQGDVRALGDDLRSRRLNTAVPEASLMLLKPVGTVPHEGGVLLTTDSIYYQILHRWIGEGAQLEPESKKVQRIEVVPDSQVIHKEGAWQQFRVVAHFPDGTVRDVTHESFLESSDTEVCESLPGARVRALRRGEAALLARYEGAYAAASITVMGNREGFVWQEPETYNAIDQMVSDKWERMKILPSPLCEDHTFLRRVSLDLTGLPPTIDELKEFIKDPRPTRIKRQQKIEQLLGSEAYIEHWTNKWSDLLQVNSKFLGPEGAAALREWIRDSVASNQPYDQFVKSILTATGSNKDNPAASYYKILRDPDLLVENTTQLFLAVRFNCNKCHDHPFERWTQDQYFELAAFFGQTELKPDPASGDRVIGGSAVEGAKPLFEEVIDRDSGEVRHERTGQVVAPQFPFSCEHHVSADATRREQLAAWLTSPDNAYFASSYVNRLWGYLTGRGLIEPLDDIRAGNPSSNPELLQLLTDEFVESGFDAQHVLRLICNSRTYQLSVASHRWNMGDTINYSRARARRLPAEVLYDSIYLVTGAQSEIPGAEPGIRAAQLPDVALNPPDGFLNNLGRPVRESACECERSDELQLGPVMALVSGPTLGIAIGAEKNHLATMASRDLPDDQLIEQVYLRVLNRYPSQSEIKAVLEMAENIEKDHFMLQNRLHEREQAWQLRRQELEQQRLDRLQATQEQVAAREEEIRPHRELLERERLEKISAAQSALDDYSSRWSEVAIDYLNAAASNHWFPLMPSYLGSSNSADLIPQSDRSIIAQGNSDKGTYTVQYRVPLRNIRGFRLEALPAIDERGAGPGISANGNFVITEVSVYAAPLTQSENRLPQKINSAKASFTQAGFDPAATFNGQKQDQGGWAIYPRGGTIQWITFAFEQPIDWEDGTELTFEIHQFHDAATHRLKRFRISVTTDAGELFLGLPEDFAALSPIKENRPDTAGLKPLIDYLEKSDPKWNELKANLASVEAALPEDEQLELLRREIERLARPIQDSREIVQLRTDYAASLSQMENRRLTLVQDLTWALINSPAFLFNH
jgi:WD40 repeat protein